LKSEGEGEGPLDLLPLDRARVKAGEESGAGGDRRFEVRPVVRGEPIDERERRQGKAIEEDAACPEAWKQGFEIARENGRVRCQNRRPLAAT
jgi:hypothetical protein